MISVEFANTLSAERRACQDGRSRPSGLTSAHTTASHRARNSWPIR
jgi:hypothetical protein